MEKQIWRMFWKITNRHFFETTKGFVSMFLSVCLFCQTVYENNHKKAFVEFNMAWNLALELINTFEHDFVRV